MLWTFSLCTLLGSGILCVLVRREHARFERARTMATTLGWPTVSPEVSPRSRRMTTDRVEKALRTWTSQRAEAERSVRSAIYRATEPSPPVSEPQPSEPAPPSAAEPQAEEPAVETMFTPPPRDPHGVLQFGPEADIETIHRVYRIMTSRFHPEKEPPGSFVPPVIAEAAPEPQSSADPQTEEAASGTMFTLPPRDHYSVLQIGPDADIETIHRVYRIMASRFHPDNQATGDVERFLLLTQAYKVLSDPARRAQYDSANGLLPSGALPIFAMKVFLDGVEGEKNRRLGVLSLLYHRRRLSDSQPGVSLLELERRMAFPREYLHFTLWYLRSKGYVGVMDDNSDYVLTALGVDYVEENASINPVIRELLTDGSGAGGGTGDTAIFSETARRRHGSKERSRRYRGKRRTGGGRMGAGSV